MNTSCSTSDKDSVSPQSVSTPSLSLPKGGGALRGIGEKYSSNLPYEIYSLAYTPSLLTHLYGANRVTSDLLIEGGFERRELPDGSVEWWLRTGRNIYEDEEAKAFFLPSGAENAFGAVTNIAYDGYRLLIESIADPLGNITEAENDYRTLQPKTITDPNGNSTETETDALGIVIKTAAIGKNGEGDTIDSPTARMEYGFAEFSENGEIIKPSWVKTYSRETHGDANTRWLETIEYSDGMGNVALAKAKAEPGADGLPRWVGTGRTVLNNKGNPVKQYEPYFSNAEGWESEAEMREQGVTPILHYDPLSRLMRTDFPDGTHSKVEFNAWEQRGYDRCDTAAGSPHENTPAITHLDSLGRPFLAIADDGTNHDIRTRTILDIEGNEKKIIDARGNTVMEYRYGIHGERGYSQSMDAGERWMLIAADEQPVCAWDSRGHRLRYEYDELRRPAKQWLSEGGSDEKLVGETIYGTSADNNSIGQIWKTYDQSGVVENVRYDFKGNLLESERQLAKEYRETIDWSANPELENEAFISIAEYDALNRAAKLLTPRNDEIMPEYDEGGLLKAVKAKLRGTETEFVTDISYNPKGQRESIEYGNGAATKYEYDDKNFRLTRLLTTRNNGNDCLQDLNYSYDQMGNIAKIIDIAHDTVFFNGQVIEPEQTFEYDALYRLTKATGKEHAQRNAFNDDEGNEYPQNIIQSPMPADATALRNYTRQWQYDEVGNILKLIHAANSNGWTRNYSYATDSNRLNSTAVGQTTVNYTHNEHGSMVSMPHLQSMQWDFMERLKHVTRGTTEAYYCYDSSGQRIRKVVEKNNASTIEERLYLGGFEIFRKHEGNVLKQERETLHIMDDAKRIALAETLTVSNGAAVNNPDAVIRYQLGNNIESAALELDEAASIISYEEYYPYGDTSYRAGRSAAEVSQKRYRYTGKEKDEESGLYYHGARYYACWLGRWTASDPAGLVDGVNLYAYCGGNPLAYNDPNGTQMNDEDNLDFSSLSEGQNVRQLSPNEINSRIDDLKDIFSQVGEEAGEETRKEARENVVWLNGLSDIEFDIIIVKLPKERIENGTTVQSKRAYTQKNKETGKKEIILNTGAMGENNETVNFNTGIGKSLLIHELRHIWQQNDPEWREKYNNKYIKIEVDAYKVQFSLEKILGIKPRNSMNGEKETTLDFIRNFFNHNDRESIRADYLMTVGYRKLNYQNPKE